MSKKVGLASVLCGDELVRCLDPGEAMTAKQIVKLTGHDRTWVTRKLAKAVEDGLVEVVLISEPNVVGHYTTKPAYRLVGGKKK